MEFNRIEWTGFIWTLGPPLANGKAIIHRMEWGSLFPDWPSHMVNLMWVGSGNYPQIADD